MLIIYNTDSIYCIPNILSFYCHNILSYIYIYHIFTEIVSISPRVGEHFLGDHRPRGDPHSHAAALGLAASRSMARNTWKLRPLKPWENPWETDGFWPVLTCFTAMALGFPAEKPGRIRGLAQLAHCKMVGQKVCTRSSSTKLQQQHYSLPENTRSA